MSAEVRTLDRAGRLCLPSEWAAGREQVALIALPRRTIGIVGVEQLAAMRAAATAEQRVYLRTLVSIASTTVCRRVTIPADLRQACSFGPLEELVIADWEDPWGWTLRVMASSQWSREVGDLFAIAQRPSFPVPRGEWARVGVAL